ncbi:MULTISPECIES: hypothetical protein [unclassified Paenibacillus]|uniref:AAA family ATPase n=1 Tax=unclassified Paenibacillus TaxID=185978 RepID=UPI001AE9F13E|nr:MULTISPECIES: hypothetical protein [unclassified Paenibacillus]MBP1157130.1 pilus assembly protein CpaE [Paenibacillus sp. PvP091]MBP1172131.1 pilus assembly protein CpaE [Paenibacillus sp. PvR098]MBP2438512.1 pilus assembly protein CpaE [Paenibacillus sp. PvP052]
MTKLLLVHPETDAADRLSAMLGSVRGYDICHTRNRDLFFSRMEEPFDIVLVHAGLLYDLYPWEWMQALRRNQPQARVTLALDASVYDSFLLETISRMADLFHFRTVPVGLTDDEMLEAFAAQVNRRQSDNPAHRGGSLTAIWSAASKDGATTIAVSTALSLAASSGMTIGLIDGNLHNPEIRSFLNLTDPNYSGFKLRSKLQTQTLTPGDLVDACVSYRKISNLHILTGSRRRDTALDVTPEMMIHLLHTCRAAFDITIVDLNSYPDNAATICTVREADHRWLVAQNNYASFQMSWGEWYECYWKYAGLTPKDISLIMNRTMAEDKPERIAELLRMPLAAAVPNIQGGLGRKAVHEGIPLYQTSGTDSFTEQIDGLAAQLAPKDERIGAGAPAAAAVRRRGGFLQRWTALFG